MNTADDLPKKIDYVKDLAKRAQDYTSKGDDKVFLISLPQTFDQSCWPQPIAEAMIKGNIQETFHKGVGIIVLDYAETDNWKLPEALIDTNF